MCKTNIKILIKLIYRLLKLKNHTMIANSMAVRYTNKFSFGVTVEDVKIAETLKKYKFITNNTVKCLNNLDHFI